MLLGESVKDFFGDRFDTRGRPDRNYFRSFIKTRDEFEIPEIEKGDDDLTREEAFREAQSRTDDQKKGHVIDHRLIVVDTCR